MAKLRVYQLAEELGLKSKELTAILSDLGVEVKSHMSGIEKPTADLVKELVLEKKEEVPKKKEVKKKEEVPKKEEVIEVAPPPVEEKKEEKKKREEIKITNPILVGDLARKCKVSGVQLIKRLIEQGLMVTINQAISAEVAAKLAADYGFQAEVEVPKEEVFPEEEVVVEPSQLVPRPPVITVMGHVDHGKTRLLDTIRKTNVMEKEVGGITQHIGAYQIEYNGKKITFIDTPGHEAFTAMRARGAKVTDIVILVVAVNDGVMPQTIEAINHAQAAKVPIMVAINKIDKPEANIEQVKKQLAEHKLVPEEWGGETVFLPISAKFGQGIEDLLGMLLLSSEMLELKANPNRPAKGVVIEAELDKGKGPVATVLIQEGTLRIGEAIIAGESCGKVRAIINDKGERIKSAEPSLPVEVFGLDTVPQAGNILRGIIDEKTGRKIVNELRLKSQIQKITPRQGITLDDLSKQIKAGKESELNLIVKADVQGSEEAIVQSLGRLKQENVRVNIIHSGVGSITETDIMLALASKAIIIGFNSVLMPSAKKLTQEESVDVRTYNVIYNLIEDIKAAMLGMLEPKFKEVIVGRAEVKATFKVPKMGVIAGCQVSEGTISRGLSFRAIRDNIVIHQGEVDSLKRFKEDVKEVTAGLECGIGSLSFDGFQEGDIIEAFSLQEVKRE